MSWITPKTNWISSDCFDKDSFNRIKGNLNYLNVLANELFYDFNISDMGSDKSYSSMIYADEFNSMGTNLATINSHTYNLNIGNAITYSENHSAPLYSDYNRIEGAILLLYNTMSAQKDALSRLAFTLGGQKGIKV